MTDPADTDEERTSETRGRPMFDPARERAIERERARERRDENSSRQIDRIEPDSETTSTQTGNVTEAGRTGSGSESGRASPAETGTEVGTETNTRTKTGTGTEVGTKTSASGGRFASAADVTGRGIGFTLLTAVLCALGYYGTIGLRTDGVQAFGSVVPAPFYALTFSVLFVFSLVPRAHEGLRALGWSIAFSVVFGVLFAVGTEGVFYLADNPDVATAGYTGLTVLALAILVSSIAYWGVLSVVKTA